MKNMKKMVALLLALVMVFALVACGPKNPTGDEKNPIKIGLLNETSGAYEVWGLQELRGFMCGLHYATDGTMEINGRPIEVIVEDTTGDVGVAVQKATKLIEDDKIDILAGSNLSNVALAVMALAAEHKVPYIINGAANDDITGAYFNEYTFRFGRTLTMATSAAFTYLDKTVGVAGTTWVLMSPDYAGGRGGNEAMAKTLTSLGATVLEEIYPPMDCADFTPYVQQVKDLAPDYLSLTLVGNNFIAKLPQQLREMGALEKTEMSCSIVDFDFLKTMGVGGIGMAGECIYHYNLYDTPVNKAFIEIHQEKYNGEYPDYWAGQSFAGAQAIVEAIKKAGSADTDAFIAAMEGLEYESVKGKMIVRAADHQALQPHAIGRIIDDGKGGTTVEAAYICSLEEMTFPVTAPGR